MKLLLVFFPVLLSVMGQAQKEYITEKNIRYYPEALSKKDDYTDSQCRLDIYYLANRKNFASIVWFHGGSLTSGDKEIPEQLMEKGYAVIGVQYRLSPKAKSPAYIEDAAAAVAWVFKNIGRYGGSDKLVVLSGHSAGGYLALMVTLNKYYLQQYGIDADSIAEVVPFSPQAITHFTIRKERGIKDTQPVIDEFAPLFHVRGNAPPLLLITGDAEMELLGRFEENAYLCRMMKLAGHKKTRLLQLQGFDHGGMRDPAFPLLLKEMSILTAGKK